MTKTDHLPPPIRARKARSLAALPTATAGLAAFHAPVPLFARVLVPLDLAGDSKGALDMALLIARATHAETTLLHVVPVLEAAPPHAFPSFYRQAELAAEKKLGAVGKRFWKKHFKVREEVRLGDPVAEILECAKKTRADLIILRSHRYIARSPSRGWATVSYKVASLCDCPVMLAK